MGKDVAGSVPWEASPIAITMFHPSWPSGTIWRYSKTLKSVPGAN